MHQPPPLRETGSPEPGNDPGSADWWDAERLLRGAPPEVQPLVAYLQGRLLRAPEQFDSPPPAVESVETAAAAVRAIREAILDAAERGAPARRVRGLHAQLDRELLGLARDVLERGSRMSQTLVREVSHDLRSPLNSILFLADALASEHSGDLNEVQRRQVGVLYRAALSLVGFVNDLVDVSRLGEESWIEVVSEPFSLEHVLNEVDQLLGPLASHSSVGLAFRLETLGPRVGDRRVLTRILINLVSNAIQASGTGDRVEVRAVEESPGDLRILVTDAGSGADITRLRAMLQTRGLPVPGTSPRDRPWTHGLGLAICGRLVEAVSGTLDVERADEGGCRFTLDLPFPRK